MCVGGVGLGGLAEEHQGPDELPLLLSEGAAEHESERIVRIEVERLLEGLFRLLYFPAKCQQLGLPAPGLGVALVLADEVGHRPQARLVLSGVVLLESPLNFRVNRLTTPLEFFAATARTGRVRIGAHDRKSPAGEGMGLTNSGYGLRAAGKSCFAAFDSIKTRLKFRVKDEPIPASRSLLAIRGLLVGIGRAAAPGGSERVAALPFFGPVDIKDVRLMVTAELGACEWFVYELRRSNLIDRSQLDQVVGDFLKRQPRAEAPALAEYLVEQGILSQFQAERVLSNKAQGLVLGPYVLIDSIGTGSMGQVYQASSKTDGAMYAVKVLPRRSMWNVRLARRQVRAFGQVNHAAVVPFVDVGTAGGLHYLVWPLVEGEPLDRLVQRQGQLTPEHAAAIGLQIAQGLSACHGQGIFHGLLKPSNIMVSPDLGASILDFGIGSLLVENEDESLVDTMSTANTLTSGLDCASPESIMEPTNRTPAGDQYSLGCLLYYCVTGRYPFPEGSAVEKMMAHQFKQPTPVKELAPQIPDALAAVVERLMQKSPEARYGAADEISAEVAS